MDRPIFKATAMAILMISTFSGVFIVPSMLHSAGVEQAPNFFINVRAANDDPGAASGIINIYVVDVDQLDSLKGANISESNEHVWAHFDATPALGESLEGNVPYNDMFGIIVQTEYNYTVAYNVSSSSWDVDYVSATLQSADLSGLGSAQDMEETSFFDTQAGVNSDIQFYHDNSDTGWQIAHGETVTCTITVKGFW